MQLALVTGCDRHPGDRTGLSNGIPKVGDQLNACCPPPRPTRLEPSPEELHYKAVQIRSRGNPIEFSKWWAFRNRRRRGVDEVLIRIERAALESTLVGFASLCPLWFRCRCNLHCR